jgi:hypothetical protein
VLHVFQLEKSVFDFLKHSLQAVGQIDKRHGLSYAVGRVRVRVTLSGPFSPAVRDRATKR